MTEAERADLSARIERIVRAEDTGIGVTGIEIEFRPNRDGELSVYVTVGMPAGSEPEAIASFLSDLSGHLVEETQTSDGFLFPYVYSRTEEEEAA